MTFHLMGGDRRQAMLARYITEKGFSATLSYHKEDTPPAWDADILILPLPASKDGHTLHAPLAQKTIPLREIYRRFEGKRIFGGMLPAGAPANATDYYQAEEVLIANADATAEGALALAIAQTPFMLAGSPALILGGGRIGRLLAAKLTALHAKVTVAARRQETIAEARALGCDARLYEDIPYHRFRLIFNTVPHEVLAEARLQQLPHDALLIELASAPGGFDAALAAEMGLSVCYAPGLPGKYSPETAAFILGDYILKEMERNG